MIERGGGSRLAFEPFDRAFAEGEVGREHLDRHRPAKVDLGGEVTIAMPPRPSSRTISNSLPTSCRTSSSSWREAASPISAVVMPVPVGSDTSAPQLKQKRLVSGIGVWQRKHFITIEGWRLLPALSSYCSSRFPAARSNYCPSRTHVQSLTRHMNGRFQPQSRSA